MCFTTFPSPLGPLLLISDGISLTGLQIQAGEPQDRGLVRQDDLPLFDAVRTWLKHYFAGDPQAVDFPISPAGTAFQQRIWNILRTIPWGSTITYGAIAGLLSRRMSARAVGQAVGKNPIAIIIPCHRCVGAKGRLTGYAWGPETKKWLLNHEEVSK